MSKHSGNGDELSKLLKAWKDEADDGAQEAADKIAEEMRKKAEEEDQ